MGLLGYFGINSDSPTISRFRALVANRSCEIVLTDDYAIAAFGTNGSNVAPIVDSGQTVGFIVGDFFSAAFDNSSWNAAKTIELCSLRSAAGSLPWGRWVTAAFDADRAELILGRDALGVARIFILSCEGGYVFGSAITDIFQITGSKPEINWKYISSYVVHDGMAGSETAFIGINEIPQAAVTSYSKARDPVSAVFWEPYLLAKREPQISSPAELKAIFKACVASWVAETPAIACGLSGGLDSSAVAWAATESRQDVVAIHLEDRHHSGAAEWNYAAQVAGFLGIPVRRIPAEVTLPLTPLSNDAPYPRYNMPAKRLLLAAENALRAELAEGRPILSGVGGDQLFVSSILDGHYLHDYLLHEPMSLIRQLVTHSRLSGVSIVSLLGGVARKELYRWRGGRTQLKKQQFRHVMPLWLNPGFRCDSDLRFISARSLVKELPRLPTAKLLQIAQVTLCSSVGRTMAENDLNGSSHRLIYPMLSQPLVELAIRLPVTSLNRDGVDRSLLRSAMRGVIPADVIKRNTKGNYTGRYQAGLRANFATAKGLIYDGVLADHGMIDSHLAVEHLKNIALGHDSHISPMLTLLTTEMWLRSWA